MPLNQETDLDTNFTIIEEGTKNLIELKMNGKMIKVNDSNKDEFIDLS